MGAARNKTQEFLSRNPICAFCGGRRPATTIEHCPPRAMFQHRQWPEGFEFPSCETCNHGADNHDLLIAFLGRMDPFTGGGSADGRTLGLMKMVNRQFPGLFQKMLPSAVEARKTNRELGVVPALGETHQSTGVVNVTPEMHDAVCVLARKLAKGIYYKETQRVFPEHGSLLLNWFTNAELLKKGDYTVFNLLKEFGGVAPPIVRSGKYLQDQFECKLTISPEFDLLVVQARFSRSFGFVVFGSTNPGQLESITTRLAEQTKQEGPFLFIQSSQPT